MSTRVLQAARSAVGLSTGVKLTVASLIIRCLSRSFDA